MLTQHYKLPLSEEMISHACIGDMVRRSDQDKVIGFVDFISDCEIAIMLFEPTDLIIDKPIEIINIQENCKWFGRLTEICNGDIKLMQHWAYVLNTEDSDLQ